MAGCRTESGAEVELAEKYLNMLADIVGDADLVYWHDDI